MGPLVEALADTIMGYPLYDGISIEASSGRAIPEGSEEPQKGAKRDPQMGPSWGTPQPGSGGG
jgi:hypothetical protein